MKTIAIVEDDAPVREVLVRLFARHGYHAIGCADGAELKEVCFAYRPDVLLCDAVMPDCWGLDAIRACEGRCGKRVFILMSGWPLDDALREGEALPPHIHFLRKPFSMQAATDLIEASLA
jgi:DNA-binding NtrC family response regulator